MHKLQLIGCLLIVSLLLSGCWSKRELNELAIVTALGIDKVDDGFEISIQIVEPSEISAKQPSAGRSPVITYHERGKTVFEAIRKITTLAARKPYFSHLQIVVIGEELAKSNMVDVLDFISRDHEFRNDFNIIVSHEVNAKEVLSILTPIEKIPASKMLNSLQASEKVWGSVLTVNIDDLINTLSNNEESAVISAITMDGSKSLGMSQTNVQQAETSTLLKYIGLAIFKNGQQIGLLNAEDSRGISYLDNKIESTVEIISCPKEGTLTTEITHAQTKIKGRFEGNMPQLKVQITIEQNVGEVECMLNLGEKKTIEMINKRTEELIHKRIEHTLQILQQDYQVDVLSFGEVLHRKDPEKWKKIKKDWLAIFSEMPIHIEVNVKTQALGTMENFPVRNEKNMGE
ncbi:Ger(x)C family spore germination protein [Lysinibacillus piscis]|uniref:Spore germination protein KC n=1 Tax=Lysinibacillus piscis TaxID=2518931 RepID=A0ABQ5NL03_9BACI|nr:Ger(x)C family spore germination protein [Lysinibacillus sp. KH24]GLC89036.1 spore germination protein KC [Lysinibacillus sp. KH24]